MQKSFAIALLSILPGAGTAAEVLIEAQYGVGIVRDASDPSERHSCDAPLWPITIDVYPNMTRPVAITEDFLAGFQRYDEFSPYLGGARLNHRYTHQLEQPETLWLRPIVRNNTVEIALPAVPDNYSGSFVALSIHLEACAFAQFFEVSSGTIRFSSQIAHYSFDEEIDFVDFLNVRHSVLNIRHVANPWSTNSRPYDERQIGWNFAELPHFLNHMPELGALYVDFVSDFQFQADRLQPSLDVEVEAKLSVGLVDFRSERDRIASAPTSSNRFERVAPLIDQ